MPPSALARGPITTRLIAELNTIGFPVGDNSQPEVDYGWQGQPNEENASFIPWMIITPGTAQPQTSAAMGDTGREWRLNYSVFYAGVSRIQTEALADRSRANLTDIVREVVPSENGDWKFQKISCPALGSVNRVGSAFPDYFTQSDSFEVWVSKA